MSLLGCSRSRLWAAALIAAVSPSVCGGATFGPKLQESEQSVKAAFVYNFSRFVTWPASAFSSPASPFVIAIVGGDSTQGQLDAITRGKQVGDRNLVVKHVDWSDIDDCNVLFVPAEESAHASRLSKIKGRPILIVSESSGMLGRGAAINLYLEQDRVQFEISRSAAKDTGLSFSSRLLSLAHPAH
jgi:hypothetical protein